MAADLDVRTIREAVDGGLERAVGVGAFALVYAYLLRDVVLGRLYTFGDFPPFYGTRAIETFLATWHFDGIGYAFIHNTLPAYLGAITVLGGPLAQNLFYLGLLPAGFLSFLVFSRRFVDRWQARYLAAGLYAINPITIDEFVNGGIGALIGFAGLPLVLHYLFRIVEGGSWDDSLKAGAAFGATTIYPWAAFWMVAPFATYLGFRARRSPRTLGKLALSGGLGVVLALPSVHHVLQRAGQFGSVAVRAAIYEQVQWNYARAEPWTVSRLAGNRGTFAMRELGYNTEPMMAIGLVIPAIALLAWRRERLRVFYGVAGLVVAFMGATELGYTYPLFEALPPLWSLRNPVKLQYPLLLSICVLFGAGVQAALSGAAPGAGRLGSNLLGSSDPSLDPDRSSRVRGPPGPTRSPGSSHSSSFPITDAVVVGLLTFCLLVYALPASGALGLETMRGDEYYVHEEQGALADRLDGLVLWAPYGYTTQLQLRHTYPDHVGVKSGGIVQGIQNADYVTGLWRDFAADPSSVHARLSRMGVRYVVVDGDPPRRFAGGLPRVVHRWDTPWLAGSPTAFDERLRAAPEYSLAFRTDEYVVYRVEGVPVHDRFERRSGLHAVVYPNGSEEVERLGGEVVTNGDFEDGLEAWWSNPGGTGTRASVVNGSEGRAVRLATDTGERVPIAQLVTVRPGYPYELDVDADGPGVVNLYWYDGVKSKENLVAKEGYPLDALPATLTARGDRVSVRVLPNSSRLLVQRASLYRTTYPSRTGVSANAAGVPGVVVDGRDDPPAGATVVAVNLDERVAARSDADVRLVDAETVLDGPLAFDGAYRQGVAVRIEDGPPPAVPADARAVTHETENGTVLDYWVVGEFSDAPVTVLYTSYDEGWVGGPDSRHFRAYGWANGFTNASPDRIEWAGRERRIAGFEVPFRGDALRRWVVGAWLVAWIAVVGALGASRVTRMRRRGRTEGDGKL